LDVENGRLVIGYTIAGKKLPNRVLARQEADPVMSPFQTEVRNPCLVCKEGDLWNRGRDPDIESIERFERFTGSGRYTM
jgi:hypothetical protein